MGIHRVFHAGLAAGERELIVDGDEAHHAVRVKRLEVNHPIVVLNGRGLEGAATITQITKGAHGWTMRLHIDQVREVPRTVPTIHIWAPAPKGPRLETMIDGLSQVGAAAWHPLVTQHTIVEPREGKLDRMHRLAAEASKQSGRAWHLEIEPGADLAQALEQVRNQGSNIVIADASGDPYLPTGAPQIALFLGPEGGWTDEELALAKARGGSISRFGPHVMRVEIAAVVACGVVLDAEVRLPRGGTRS